MNKIIDVFKIKNNYIFVTNDIHNYKEKDIIKDEDGNLYEIISIAFESNDLYVRPLNKLINKKIFEVELYR